MIVLKSGQEIELMKKAGEIVRDTLALMESMVRPGISTLELDREAERFILGKGASASFKGYNGFPGSICTSPNAMVVHGIPSKKVVLHEGDIISVDVGAELNGYHADAARTYPVGTVEKETLRLIAVTEQCFYEGLKHCRVGERIGDIGAAIQKYAEGAGYTVVRELIGHGVGRNLHEPPDVPNYGHAGHGVRLDRGLTIAIEPMINMGVRNVYQLADGWGVVTRDGKPSSHYENTVAITDAEPLILTL